MIEHDRGLGSAYERYVFYQWLDRWATTYGIESALEGPVDGMAGVPGVHGVGLARRGIPVVSAVSSEAQAVVTRGVYARAEAPVTVRVVHDLEDPSLAPADLVIAYHALSFVPDWRAYVKRMAKLAKKLLVVTVCNPDNWGVNVMQLVARARGMRGFEAPESWHTETLSPVLWEVGRVREHVYFDCPWWPDVPVSAGQSVTDRLRQLVGQLKNKEDVKAGGGPDAKLADKFVYDGSKWPYFGGAGWIDELFPALVKHPCFDGSTMKSLPRFAHLHAFVVDMRPRTPQARRRLAQL